MSETKKLESLTPEQEKIMHETREKWLDRFFSCKHRTNHEKATEFINYIYDMAGFKPPKVIFTDSPQACQEEVFKLKNGKREPEQFAHYGNVWDYAWVAFYDFFHQIDVVHYDQFVKYRDLLWESNVYNTIQLEDYCIVSDMPTEIHREKVQLRLHNEEGAAIKFADGYSLYYWNGTNVPEKWIMQKDKIDAKDINGESNAEKRRCLMEILGADEYYERLGGVEVIDEDTDAYGKPMTLLRSKQKDKIINDYVYFLRVVDTSTDRVYNIYPNVRDFPKAKENVWSAKASTFNMNKEEFDVTEES
jgi:hypothetical protein